jgi:hypothetical protein
LNDGSTESHLYKDKRKTNAKEMEGIPTPKPSLLTAASTVKPTRVPRTERLVVKEEPKRGSDKPAFTPMLSHLGILCKIP